MATVNQKEGWRVIGANIRRLRLEANMTQEQLAREVGVTGATISRIEAGAKDFTVGLFIDIARALKEPPDLLLRVEKTELVA